MTIQRVTRLLVVSSGLLWLGGWKSPAAGLGEALNAPFAVWNKGGNTNLSAWNGQTNVFRVDGKAAASGAITNNQTTWMETTVSGVTNVSFWWKVSSEEDFDYLTFYVNGLEKVAISGTNVDWQLVSFAITNAGTSVLRWTYSKDGSDLFDPGADRGWVDEVSFNPFTLTTPARLLDGRMQFTVNFGAGWPCRVFYSTNLAAGGWTLLVTTNTTSAATIVIDPGATNSPARFYRAQSP